MSIFKDFGAASKRNAAPATTGIVVVLIACFVAIWAGATGFASQLVFYSAPSMALARPWTFITYPFVADSAVGVIFACLWLWGLGGSLERDLGSLRFLIAWLVFSALSAIFVLLGTALFHVPATPLHSAWVPISMVTVMWGTRNPDAPITLMFVLPVTGKWIAWLSVALVLLGTSPQVAVFAAIPCALAYFFAANKIPFIPFAKSDQRFMGTEKKWERYDKSYYDEVQRREKDREERDRLRKLFEGSLQDDPEKDR
jgi:membrane associated rhomboid family serine protease